MNEDSTIESLKLLRQQQPCNQPFSPALLQQIKQATVEYPESSHIWWMAGVWNELAMIDGVPPLLDPMDCYRKSAALDPDDPDPWVEMGYFLDTHRNDFSAAESAFCKAMQIDPTNPEVHLGLARVLAQQGRASEAIDLLDRMPPGHDDARQQLQKEIRDGQWCPLPEK